MANSTGRTIDEVITDIGSNISDLKHKSDVSESSVNMAEAVSVATTPLLEVMSSINDNLMKFFRFQELHTDDNEREDDSDQQERVGLLKQIVDGITGVFGRGSNDSAEKEEGGGAFDMLKGLFGAPIKGIGGLLKMLARLGGPLAAIGAIISFAQGFTNAEAIVGRDGLNIIEKVGAGVANLVADIMGIVTRIMNFFLPENMQLSTMFDPAEIYLKIERLTEIIMDVFRWIDENVMEPLRSAFGWMITNLTPTNIINTITSIGEFFVTAWDNTINRITEFKDNVLALINGIIEDPIGYIGDILNFYKSIPGRIWNAVSAAFDLIFDLMGFDESFSELTDRVWRSVTGFVTDIIDKITGFIDDIKTSITGAFDNLKTVIREKFDALTDVKGWFGLGDDDIEPSAQPSGSNPDLSTDATAASAVAAMNNPNFNDLPTDLPPPPASTTMNTNMTNTNNTVMTVPVSGGNPDSYSRFMNSMMGPNRFSYM